MELIDKTLGQCLHEQALKFSTKDAIDLDDFSCSYQELDNISSRIALKLQKLNIVRGTHVGIWGVNSAKWVILFYALEKLGAVPVLINTCYREIEVRDILNHFDTEVLFYGEGYKDLVYRDILDNIEDELHCVHDMFAIEDFIEYDFAPLDEEHTHMLNDIMSKLSSSDPACMIFTSGTTSLPKGVVLTHHNLVNNSLAMIKAMHWNENDKMCISVPLFHCFGITAGIVSCMLSGMSFYLLAYFKTNLVWNAIENCGCTVLNGVPSMFLALVKKEKYKDRNGNSLKSGIIAGSAFKASEYMDICRRFPNMHLQPSYGQTETSPCISIADWDEDNEIKALSGGKVIENVDVRIADPLTNVPLETGTVGEIQVKGYNVMQGYYNMSEANKRVFTDDGWLKCGDLGYLDKDNFLYVTGRIKEMIIRAGENISPFEIEEAIMDIDAVEQVKVVGVPAQVRQEEIAACIVLKEGRNISLEQIKEYLNRRLAHYKVPEYYIFLEKLPLNASGKIDLKEIKKIALLKAEEMRLLNQNEI
ncbi:MAG: class I adenylate-forming enzyme family protein [Eubacteriales bacterium]|nr:class I adenylate-forming enzyme family protein [Eubacteriales bacterium]